MIQHLVLGTFNSMIHFPISYSRTSWDTRCFYVFLLLWIHRRMVNWWFGARWFGFLGFPKMEGIVTRGYPWVIPIPPVWIPNCQLRGITWAPNHPAGRCSTGSSVVSWDSKGLPKNEKGGDIFKVWCSKNWGVAIQKHRLLYMILKNY